MVYTLEEFRFSEHSKKPHYLVIGFPVGHSLSPLMHQTALDYHNIDASYVALNLYPYELSSFAAWCNRDEFLGCNITIPFKNEMFSLVDEIEPAAAQIGAINTISKENGKLVGFNTDVYGFIKPLDPFQHKFETGRAIIFGTGGSSKAVKRGLEELGFRELVFVTRTPSGKVIDSESDTAIIFADYNQWTAYAPEADIIINTTPLGMPPNSGRSPVDWNDAEYLGSKICYDLVYNPPETEFLKQAKKYDSEIINGLDMLIYQGSRSFHIWTGKSFPVTRIRNLLKNHLQGL